MSSRKKSPNNYDREREFTMAADKDDSLELSLTNEEKLAVLIQKELKQQQEAPVVERRDSVVKYMSDVCNEASKSPYVLLSSATKILDSFLAKFNDLPPNLQALGSACIIVAAKSRKIKLNTDCLTENPSKEVKAWEQLVLTKLDWQINLVVPQDYFDLLLQEISPAKTKNPLQDVPLSREPATPPTAHDNQLDDLKTDAALICSVCCQSAQISRNPPRLLAFCALLIAAKQYEFPGVEGEVEMRRTLRVLRLKEEPKSVKDLMLKVQELVCKVLPLSRENSPTKRSYASVLKGQSPEFKITTSSTPKSKLPLKESTNVELKARRRLISIEEDVRNLSLDKENNDSAIGMMLNCTPDCPSAGSKESSPGDSGASSADSPPSQDSLTKTKRLLKTLNP